MLDKIKNHKTLPPTLSCFSSPLSSSSSDIEIGVQFPRTLRSSFCRFANGLDVDGRSFKFSVSIERIGMFSARCKDLAEWLWRKEGNEEICGKPFRGIVASFQHPQLSFKKSCFLSLNHFQTNFIDTLIALRSVKSFYNKISLLPISRVARIFSRRRTVTD